jgi:hypothetical protein
MNSSSEEWLNNLIPYSKRNTDNTTTTTDDSKLYKTTGKNEDQFDLFGSATQMQNSNYHQQYYNTLENTTHSYQNYTRRFRN